VPPAAGASCGPDPYPWRPAALFEQVWRCLLALLHAAALIPSRTRRRCLGPAALPPPAAAQPGRSTNARLWQQGRNFMIHIARGMQWAGRPWRLQMLLRLSPRPWRWAGVPPGSLVWARRWWSGARGSGAGNVTTECSAASPAAPAATWAAQPPCLTSLPCWPAAAPAAALPRWQRCCIGTQSRRLCCCRNAHQVVGNAAGNERIGQSIQGMQGIRGSRGGWVRCKGTGGASWWWDGMVGGAVRLG
jgi:hypothetical protein